MRILIAEDDAVLANGIVHSLTQASHAVDHVSDGAKAYAMVQATTYDLVILDLGLPTMDGLITDCP